jgi:creatinine amidohydrolase
VGSLELERLTWPEVRAHQKAGRLAVVCALGATEQHGPHLPLATDSLLGDRLARLVADRLDAFVAPTVRIGCSEHHLGFPGTLSLSEQTFSGLVADLVRSFARGGFRRAVLIPTNKANFAALAAALATLGRADGIEVAAVTDPGVLSVIGLLAADDYGVPVQEGGLHAGEWETSMVAALQPGLVRMSRREVGYIGDPGVVCAALASGVGGLAENGVIGDPRAANAEHGRHYWEVLLALVLQAIGET